MIMKIPPHNIEAEISILGSILMDNKVFRKVSGIVSYSDFYNKKHQAIYQAMSELLENKEIVDFISLNDKLKSMGTIDVAGGIVYVSQLADNVVTTANAVKYSNMVKNRSISRRLILSGNEMISRLYEGQDSVEEVLHDIRGSVSSVSLVSNDVEVHSMKEIMKSTVNSLEKTYENKGQLTGIPTGFKALDRMMSGFQRSDFIVLAGRPSMGKSVLADMFLQHSGVPSLFFSLEMSKDRYAKRAISSTATIDHDRTTSAHFKDTDWHRLTDAMDVLTQKDIYVVDKSNLSIDKIVDISERLKEEKDIQMVVVDYLQFVTARHDKGRSREQEVSEISRKLKGLAKDLNIPVVALAQLNRGLEQRPDKRPMLSDLRESGSIEQDADVVMLLYRPEYYNFTDNDIDKLYGGWGDKPKSLDGLAELNVAKGRDMRLGTVFLRSELQFQRFVDYENVN